MGHAERAVRSVLELGGVNVVHYALNLGVQIALARLLSPDIFGTVTLAVAMLALMGLPGRWGISEAILQDTKYEAVLSTVFWIRVAYTVGFLALVIILSYPIGYIYQKDVAFVLYILGGTYALRIATDPLMAPIQREFRLRQLGIARFAALVVASALSIVLALRGENLLSLVSFYAIQDVLVVLSLVVIAPEYPRRTFSYQTAVWFAQFAKDMLPSKILDVADDRADDFFVGTLTTTATLGLYNVAWQLTWAFSTVAQQALNVGIAPAFSRIQDDEDLSRRGIEFVSRMLLYISTPGYVFLALVAPDLIRLTFGPQWVDATGMVRIMSLAGIVIPVLASGRQFYYARGEANRVLAVQRYYLLVMGIGIVTLVPFFGGMGAAVAVTITQVTGCALIFYHLHHDVGFRAGKVLPPAVIAGSTAATVGYLFTESYWDQVGASIYEVVITGILVTVMFFLTSYATNSSTMREDAELIWSSLRG